MYNVFRHFAKIRNRKKKKRETKKEKAGAFHFENEEVGRWSGDYLAIGTSSNHVQFSLQCSRAHKSRALSSTYTRTEVYTQSTGTYIYVRVESERIYGK